MRHAALEGPKRLFALNSDQGDGYWEWDDITFGQKAQTIELMCYNPPNGDTLHRTT